MTAVLKPAPFAMVLFLFAGPWWSGSVQARSQEIQPGDSTAVPSERPADSARLAPPIQTFQFGDTSGPVLSDTVTHYRPRRSQDFSSSPTGALVRSVVFPGWGQWSNGKRQKAAVYFAVESYFITKALMWRHEARQATALEFEHARDRRNYFYWLTGITVFISMFDAYADRYLLTLERTRDAGDEYWGSPPQSWQPKDPEWRVTLTYRF